jgi:hypothetical protein
MNLMAIFSMANFKVMGALNRNRTNMKANLKTASIMVKASTPGVQAMFTRGPIKMGRSTGMESTRLSMDQSTKAIGRMVKEMARALRYHLMERLKTSYLTWESKSLACNDIRKQIYHLIHMQYHQIN